VESTDAICIMPRMDHRIPITVLTGFLGSGKTTLLSQLLRQPGMKDTAVVINEIGATGLDHLLVRNVEDTYIADNTVLLGSGCLCCILRTELADTLRDLYFKRTFQAIPHFDRLVIETTGLADPGPILANLLNAEVIRDHYRLDAVIVTVDSRFGLEQLSNHEEAVKQAAVADVLLLTKTDLCPPHAVDTLIQSLAVLNPGATCHRITQGRIEAGEIVDIGLFDRHQQRARPTRWLRVPDQPNRPGALPLHAADISTITLTLPETLTSSDLQSALEQLCAQEGARLLRLKGIVHLADIGTVAVHAVQHVIYPFTPLPTSDYAGHSRLVLIGKSLDQNALQKRCSMKTPHKRFVSL